MGTITRTVLSFSLGTVAFLIALDVYYPNSSFFPVEPISVNSADPVVFKAAKGVNTGVDLPHSGRGVILFPIERLAANDYPFLSLELDNYTAIERIYIVWRNSISTQRTAHRLPEETHTENWIFNASQPEWKGDILELGIMIEGRPGERVNVLNAQLLPWTNANLIKAIQASWQRFDVWQFDSINLYKATETADSPFPQIPLIALWIGLSLLCYLALHVFSNSSTSTAWTGAACIFVVGWLCIDTLWQRKLIMQLQHTWSPYDDKLLQDRILIDTNAAIARMAHSVIDAIGPNDRRIFVNSNDEYLAMRSAFALYPRNVYWNRKQVGQLPTEHLGAGDYITLVQPTSIKFRESRGELVTSTGDRISAKQVWVSDSSALYEVQ
ncbi:hypothetical protein OAN12_06715 [Halioglobus sp.]|nr:hypothetical protein [Halioglobus sp.]